MAEADIGMNPGEEPQEHYSTALEDSIRCLKETRTAALALSTLISSLPNVDDIKSIDLLRQTKKVAELHESRCGCRTFQKSSQVLGRCFEELTRIETMFVAHRASLQEKARRQEK